MQRTAVNPWPWSLNFGYNQAEIVEGAGRQVVIAGQTAMDAEGNPQHPGDMRRQFELALENLEAVLAAADMDLTNLTKVTIFSTDLAQTMANFDVYGARLGPIGATPPMSVVGVTGLAVPPLMIEIEATAAD